MKTVEINGYWVAGNDYIAIAINMEDPSDAHYFTRKTMIADGIEQGAYAWAIAWTSPGI